MLWKLSDHLNNEEVEVDESIGSAIDKTLGAAGEVADTAIKLPAKGIGYLKGLKKGIKKAAKKGEDKAAGDAGPKNEEVEVEEGYEDKKKGEVLAAMKRQGRKLSDKDKDKIANKVVASKGDTSKSDDRYAYEELDPGMEHNLSILRMLLEEVLYLKVEQEVES